MKAPKIPVLVALAGAAGSAAAHHSFAPHFDPQSSISITGTVIEFEQRNPHSYLHIAVDAGSDESREYICESSGITQLRRNGVHPELLQPGSTVTVTGQRHRRDAYRCFFRTVQVGSGRVISATDAGAPLEEAGEGNVDADAGGIFGNWLLIPAGDRAGNGETYEEMIDHMTAAGQRAEASYDALKDDPVYRCHPIGLRRVWFAPGTPTEISLRDDHVVIRHEWMDVERVVYLNDERPPPEDTPALFGHSTGRLENGVLTIMTTDYPAGVIRQYLGKNNQAPYRGLLHSARLTTTEILRYDEDDQSLEVTMLFRDPAFYTRDFPPVTTRYERTDLEIRPFGCTPDD
jgi:hypothetical protein